MISVCTSSICFGKCFSQGVVNSYLKVFVIWKHGRIWFIGNVDIFNISVPEFFGRKIGKLSQIIFRIDAFFSIY